MTHPEKKPAALHLLDTLQTFHDPSWNAWRAALAALDGVPLTDAQAVIFRRHTGRASLPSGAFCEAFFIVGRRGGKSRIAALKAVEAAAFRIYRFAPGERCVVMVIAADRRQARVVYRYIAAYFDLPALKQLVVSRTAEALHLRTGVSIEIHTASYRAVRGPTIVCCIADELAFWRDETSANPDTEILAAIRPAMATVPGAQLICISSPYARRGALWDAYRRSFGKDDARTLIWQADTRSMNPMVDEEIIREAYDRDPSAAAAEYGAEFRRDIEGYLSAEHLAAVVIPGRVVLPAVTGVKYLAFVDPSGSASDSMTLGIAHADEKRAVLDLVVERRPPFSPESVVKDFAAVLREYGIKKISGDRYAGEWPRERFREQGVTYEIAETPKSEIYLEMLPAIMSGGVEMLDNPRLLAQVQGLERRTARGGRDSIDHAPNAHDDLANSAAGALVLVLRARVKPRLQVFAPVIKPKAPPPEGETPRRSPKIEAFLRGA